MNSILRLWVWALLALMLAFLVNNAFMLSAYAETHIFGLSSLSAFAVIFLAGATVTTYVRSSLSFRSDANLLHAINCYLVRAIFFSVLFVGIADVVIAFIRVEGVLIGFLGEETFKLIKKPLFVGPNIHLPIIGFSFILAAFTRTLGFHWLALLIVLAELLIVICRFVFSYEQAFMGDLVRYWYAALFLISSAYTLYDGGHVRVDVLYSGFSRYKKAKADLAGAFLLGISTCWAILIVGFNGKQSLINMPVLNFEVSQAAIVGMFIKYQMAAFLGVFAITMMIQFLSSMLDNWANITDEPGARDTSANLH